LIENDNAPTNSNPEFICDGKTIYVENLDWPGDIWSGDNQIPQGTCRLEIPSTTSADTCWPCCYPAVPEFPSPTSSDGNNSQYYLQVIGIVGILALAIALIHRKK
jgi:hypothetical protein